MISALFLMFYKDRNSLFKLLNSLSEFLVTLASQKDERFF